MTLSRLGKDEIVNYIKDHPDLQIDPDQTKASLIEELMVLGVTSEQITTREADEEQDERVLVKMIRPNWTYEVRGYKFTKRHPILVVDKDTADFLLSDRKSFVPATPQEVKELYS